MVTTDRELRDVLGEALEEQLASEWITRRNKAHATRQWEVVHDWGGDLISEDTQAVVGRYWTFDAADKVARALDYARDARQRLLPSPPANTGG